MSEQRPTSELSPHPDSREVPVMRHAEFAAFLADIASHGIREPLEITGDGTVIDGHHRLRAARELGVEAVPVRVCAVPEDPLSYMLSGALQRRQLSESRRAAVAWRLETIRQASAAADKRRRANLRQHTSSEAALPVCGRVRTLAAEFAGVSERTMQDVITVDHHDRDLFEQIFNGAISAKKARKQLQQRQRHAGIGEAPPLPGGRFGLIYADPPWQLGNPDSDYAPEQYYPTMPLAEICALRVPAAVDALLYLWAVNSHLRDALSVMDAWGFVYVANFAWDKGSIGMGVWARNQHELLLVGRKGKASPPSPADRQPSVIAARRGRHSEKPVVVCQMLERMHPHLSKLELFARGTPRPGWTVWGNEVDQAEAA